MYSDGLHTHLPAKDNQFDLELDIQNHTTIIMIMFAQLPPANSTCGRCEIAN